MTGLVFTLVYIAFTYISVGETFPAIAEYRPQLVLAAAAALASVPKALSEPIGIASLQSRLMAAFSAALLFSWVPHGWLGGITKAATVFAPMGIVFFLVVVNCTSLPRFNALRIGLIIITAYMLGRGIFEYHTMQDASPYVMHQGGQESYVLRLQGLGILKDPNAYSQYLLTLIPFLFIHNDRSHRWLRRFFSIGLLAFFLYGIYLTRSRGAMMGLGFLAGLTVWDRGKKFAAGLVPGVVFGSLLLMNFSGGREVSIEGGMDRLNLWSEGLGLFKASPVWGTGFGSFADNADLTAHNSFLLCATELGIIGYYFWMALLLLSAWPLHVLSKKADEPLPGLHEWAKAVRFSLYSFLFTSFFISRTYHAPLYLLLGMSVALQIVDSVSSDTPLAPLPRRWASWTAALCVGSIVLIWALVRLRAV